MAAAATVVVALLLPAGIATAQSGVPADSPPLEGTDWLLTELTDIADPAAVASWRCVTTRGCSR